MSSTRSNTEVVNIQCNSSAEGGLCDIFIVGTDHGNMDSYRHVSRLIKRERPETVFLEMCDERFAKLVAEEDKMVTEVQPLKDLFYMWLQGKLNLLHFLGNWYSMKRRSLKKQPVIKSEFQIGYVIAKQIHAKVVPGDRPVKITMDRLWARLTIIEKAFFTCVLFFSILFWRPPKHNEDANRELTDGDVEFFGFFPRFYKSIWEERQMYMAYNLSKEAMECSSIVAVVGRAHLSGILKHCPLASPIVMEELCKVPVQERTSIVRILALVGVVIAILLSIFLWRK